MLPNMSSYSSILTSLASGKKTRSQIANELELPPPVVAGALAAMLNSGQVVVSGKSRVKGKDVSVYAVPNAKTDKRGSSLAPLEPKAVAKLLKSNLFLMWGGYTPLDTPPLEKLKLTVRKYIENESGLVDLLNQMQQHQSESKSGNGSV
jgi:hypothetical protein